MKMLDLQEQVVVRLHDMVGLSLLSSCMKRTLIPQAQPGSKQLVSIVDCRLGLGQA